MTTTIAFLAFLPVAAAAFAVLPVRPAILAVFLGGWLVLPVGHFPDLAPEIVFPWMITGAVVPSSMLVTKAWIAPVVALALALAVDRARLAGWRPGAVDAAMAAFCLWPLAAGLVARAPDPAPAVSALYLAGAWGAPWLLGRVWFADAAGRFTLIRGLALAGLACLPYAVLEGMRPPFLHEALYAPHPWDRDGIVRYLGYRPMALFENGNQYGIWVAMGALSALWLAMARGDAPALPRVALAATCTAIAIASQSVGAVMMIVGGLALVWLMASRLVLALIAAGALGAGAVLALAAAGILPLEEIVRGTAAGKALIEAFRDIGRFAFLWRFAQDINALSTLPASPLIGAHDWDWFMGAGTRPWGTWQVILGQFGLVGVGLVLAALLPGVLAARAAAAGIASTDPGAAPRLLAAVLLAAMADAALNSFLYFPALLAAGAIAGGVRAAGRDGRHPPAAPPP